jgi:hypothetical protein
VPFLEREVLSVATEGHLSMAPMSEANNYTTAALVARSLHVAVVQTNFCACQFF